MLKEVIVKQIREFLQIEMPHTLLPQAVYARVTKGGNDKVSLRILDKSNQDDENYSELPDIKTEVPYEKDDIVLLSFIYGELEKPVIVRKCDHLPQIRLAKVLSGGTSMTVQLLDKNGGVDTLYEPFTIENDYPLESGDTAIISFLHCGFSQGKIIRKYGGWKKTWWKDCVV